MSDPPRSPGEPKPSGAPEARRRRGRSLALLLVLIGLAALFYLITIVKMSHA
jgi:hypothetical protein